MKFLVAISFVLLLNVRVFSQTKMYISTGRSVSNIIVTPDFYIPRVGAQVRTTDNSYNTQGFSRFWSADFQLEKRLNKVLNGVTGISFFQGGYDDGAFFNDPTIGNFHSKLDISNIGIPLLFRANIINAVMVDLGFVVTIPLQAHLTETRNSGTQYEQTYNSSISSSLTTDYLGGSGGYLAFTVLINRFTISLSWQRGQYAIDEKLLDSWPLGDGSMFTRDFYPKFSYETIYFKIGMRLK